MSFRPFLIYLSLLLLSACQESKNADIADSQVIKIDTGNAQKTYEAVKGRNLILVDSIYEGLSDALTSTSNFPLLFQHLDYYRKIRGDGLRTQALIALGKGYYYSRRNDIDSGNYFFSQAINRYQKLDMKRALAAGYSGLIANHIFRADYANALAYQYKALHIYEQLRDTNACYAVKTHMLRIFKKQKEYSKAIDVAHEARTYYLGKGDIKSLASVDVSLADLHYQLKHYGEAMEYAQSSLERNRQTGDREEIARSLNTIAIINTALEQWGSAAQVFTECLALVKDQRQLPVLKYNLAVALQNLGKPDSAAGMLRLLAEDRGIDPELRARSYGTLTDVYEHQKQYGKALEYHKKYKAALDSVYSRDKEQIIRELNIKYDTQKKREQIARLEVGHKADEFKKIAYLSGMVLVFIIGILVALFLRSKNRQHRLVILQAHQELESHRRELDLFTGRMLSNNELIASLEAKLTEMSDTAASKVINDESLGILYQFKILTDEHWREFKLLFDKVYPGVIARLRATYPDLAPAEERQFLLIRLNLTNKECAEMLGISQESVTKNRYRLKKRFNLTEQDNLDLFVKSI